MSTRLSPSTFQKTAEIQAKIAADFAAFHSMAPNMAEAFLEGMATAYAVSQTTSNGKPGPRSSKGSAALEAIAALLARTQNHGLTKTELASATSLTESQVHSAVYLRPGADLFEKVKNPKGGREKIVRLTKPEFEKRVSLF
jgi:hypothetical protein